MNPKAKKQDQERRAALRQSAPALLMKKGINFTSHNGGSHLVIDENPPIDFWPGTERWRTRNGKDGFGVQALLSFIEEERALKEISK